MHMLIILMVVIIFTLYFVLVKHLIPKFSFNISFSKLVFLNECNRKFPFIFELLVLWEICYRSTWRSFYPAFRVNAKKEKALKLKALQFPEAFVILYEWTIEINFVSVASPSFSIFKSIIILLPKLIIPFSHYVFSAEEKQIQIVWKINKINMIGNESFFWKRKYFIIDIS